MPTPDFDRAYLDFLKTTGKPDTEEARAAFTAGFSARGELDTKAVRTLRKGGWILPDRDTGYNFAIADAIRHISFVGGTPRRVIR